MIVGKVMKRVGNRLGPGGRVAFIAVLVGFFVCGPAGGQDFTLTEQQFNQWLTGGMFGTMSPQQLIGSQLDVQIHRLEEACRLTPEQKEKIRLAGLGDAARFEDRVSQLRKKMVDKSYDQNEVNEIFQEIQPLQQEYQAGLLGEGSLFRKVLDRTLDDGQKVEYEAMQAERRAARYAARVRLYVATLERSAPMTAKQRQALLDLLLETTRPPQRFGENDMYYVMFQASQAPEEKLADIFDAAQLRVLRPALKQGSGYASFLRQQGFVPAKEAVDNDAKRKLNARRKPKSEPLEKEESK